MWIKTLRRHPHGGKQREVGSIYNCPDKKARLLISIGKAEEAPAPKQSAAPLQNRAASVPQNTNVETTPVQMTPAAQKLIEENKLDPKSIKATGSQGQITKSDVETAINGG